MLFVSEELNGFWVDDTLHAAYRSITVLLALLNEFGIFIFLIFSFLGLSCSRQIVFLFCSNLFGN